MISQLSAKYQFCAIHTADTTDGKVTTRVLLSIESEKVHRLYLPALVAFSDSLTKSRNCLDLSQAICTQ